MKLPFIFIFDIDNTIIGNIGHQNNEYKILELINPSLIKNYDITEDLKFGLLRPNFKDFIEFIKNKYKNVEIYVYTNSSYLWTNNVVIHNIEKVIECKINEPYFTRDDSNNHNKLLGNIYDNIIDNLISKYLLLKQDKYKEYVFQNQLVFIDDIKDNLKDYPQKQILCPKYNYRDCYDIKANLINKLQIEEIEFEKKEVLDYFNDKWIPIYSTNGSIYQQDKIYQHILQLLLVRKTELLNNDDNFFKSLISILEKEEKLILDDKMILNINEKLNINNK
jgi:hypothetical protein